jgi:hypothetical protein
VAAESIVLNSGTVQNALPDCRVKLVASLPHPRPHSARCRAQTGGVKPTSRRPAPVSPSTPGAAPALSSARRSQAGGCFLRIAQRPPAGDTSVTRKRRQAVWYRRHLLDASERYGATAFPCEQPRFRRGRRRRWLLLADRSSDAPRASPALVERLAPSAGYRFDRALALVHRRGWKRRRRSGRTLGIAQDRQCGGGGPGEAAGAGRRGGAAYAAPRFCAPPSRPWFGDLRASGGDPPARPATRVHAIGDAGIWTDRNRGRRPALGKPASAQLTASSVRVLGGAGACSGPLPPRTS